MCKWETEAIDVSKRLWLFGLFVQDHGLKTSKLNYRIWYLVINYRSRIFPRYLNTCIKLPLKGHEYLKWKAVNARRYWQQNLLHSHCLLNFYLELYYCKYLSTFYEALYNLFHCVLVNHLWKHLYKNFAPLTLRVWPDHAYDPPAAACPLRRVQKRSYQIW